MKLTFGQEEIKIRDYFDTIEMKRDKARRVTVILDDSSESLDVLSNKIERSFDGSFTISEGADSENYDGFSVTEITKNRDVSSTRLSIGFEKVGGDI